MTSSLYTSGATFLRTSASQTHTPKFQILVASMLFCLELTGCYAQPAADGSWEGRVVSTKLYNPEGTFCAASFRISHGTIAPPGQALLEARLREYNGPSWRPPPWQPILVDASANLIDPESLPSTSITVTGRCPYGATIEYNSTLSYTPYRGYYKDIDGYLKDFKQAQPIFVWMIQDSTGRKVHWRVITAPTGPPAPVTRPSD